MFLVISDLEKESERTYVTDTGYLNLSNYHLVLLLTIASITSMLDR